MVVISFYYSMVYAKMAGILLLYGLRRNGGCCCWKLIQLPVLSVAVELFVQKKLFSMSYFLNGSWLNEVEIAIFFHESTR